MAKQIKLDKAATIKIIVFIVLPIVLVLVAYFLYRQYFFENRFINKVILQKDMEFNYFTYDEMDSPQGAGDIAAGVDTYYRKGKQYINDSGKNNFKEDTLKMLDEARNIIEQEWNKNNLTDKIYFVINSGYRTPSRNSEVGGVTNSAHVNGMAVDIAWSKYNSTQKEVIKDSLERVGFKRFGIANSFIHVDNDPTKPTPAQWTY